MALGMPSWDGLNQTTCLRPLRWCLPPSHPPSPQCGNSAPHSDPAQQLSLASKSWFPHPHESSNSTCQHTYAAAVMRRTIRNARCWPHNPQTCVAHVEQKFKHTTKMLQHHVESFTSWQTTTHAAHHPMTPASAGGHVNSLKHAHQKTDQDLPFVSFGSALAITVAYLSFVFVGSVSASVLSPAL